MLKGGGVEDHCPPPLVRKVSGKFVWKRALEMPICRSQPHPPRLPISRIPRAKRLFSYESLANFMRYSEAWFMIFLPREPFWCKNSKTIQKGGIWAFFVWSGRAYLTVFSALKAKIKYVESTYPTLFYKADSETGMVLRQCCKKNDYPLRSF